MSTIYDKPVPKITNTKLATFEAEFSMYQDFICTESFDEPLSFYTAYSKYFLLLSKVSGAYCSPMGQIKADVSKTQITLKHERVKTVCYITLLI